MSFNLQTDNASLRTTNNDITEIIKTTTYTRTNNTTNTTINSTTNRITMNVTQGNERNNLTTYAAQPYNDSNNVDNRTQQIANSNLRNLNFASKLNVLNIKSIYYLTISNKFYKDSRFLKVIDHEYNTKRRARGRYKIM